MAPKHILQPFNITGLVAIIVARFSRWLNAPCHLIDPDGTSPSRQRVGAYGEKVASAWLRSQKCKILATNFRARRGGEVDIIARDGKLLLFVEVKSRREGSRVRPFDAVDKPKQALITKGANAWLKQLGTRDIPWRFDVIEIHLKEGRKPRVNHIRNAF